MAENENVNKVIYGDMTLMDITDTTANENSVADGEVFYKANGARSTGAMQYVKTITFNGITSRPDSNRDITLAETDPTVPSWAKQSTKPTYTASEVGAIPDPQIMSYVDLDKANNNVSSFILKRFQVVDKNNSLVGYVEVVAYSDGSVKTSLGASNKKDGDSYTSTISITKNKDLTTNYYVSSPDAFRTAINTYSKEEIDAMVATLAETKSYLGIS